jgi:extradiol dioxygenase family protein
VRPVFHLSIPVRDLDEAVAFYREILGADIGRHTEGFADAHLFGAQVTLQNDPASVSTPMPRTRHFGATLPWEEWEEAAARLAQGQPVVEPPTVSDRGRSTEQAKMMIADPSGNLIEIKAYRRPGEILGSLPADTTGRRQIGPDPSTGTDNLESQSPS